MPTHPTASQLAPALLRTGSPVLFALAGEPLAEALVAGTWSEDRSIRELVDAMVQRLPDVAEAAERHSQPALLVDLAAAVAMLGLIRSDLGWRLRFTLADLVRRIPPPDPSDAVEALRLRALLHVATGRDAVARNVVEALDRRGDVLGATLGRWAAGQRRRGLQVSRLDSLASLTRRFADQAPARVLTLAAAALPEPSLSAPRVAPRRRSSPVRR